MPGGDYFYRARPGAPLCLVAFGDVIDQRHLFAAEQLFDIDENQHTLAERAKTGEILGRQRYREFRRRADLFGGERQHVRDAVDHNPHHPLAEVKHDNHRVSS